MPARAEGVGIAVRAAQSLVADLVEAGHRGSDEVGSMALRRLVTFS